MKITEEEETNNSTNDEQQATTTTAAAVEQLVDSLLNSITQTQAFKSKWSVIRTKLTTLQTHLASASLPQTQLTRDLLTTLTATLTQAFTLSALCHSVAPPQGKLKTQSDIDSVSALLDSHLQDLDVILKTTATTTGTVPSSSVSSRRESIRAEARNLITRLQIGTADSKSLVLDSFLGLLQEDDKNVLIAVAQGAVPVLVKLLDFSSSLEIKEKTVTALAIISVIDSCKHVLISEGLGLLNHLLRVLESGSVFAKEKSCVALQALSHSKENARAIGSRGGVSSLLEICQSGTPNSQAVAAGVLKNLAAFEDVKESFVEENAVSTLLMLCNSGTTLAQENAIGCLCNLISGDDDLKLVVAREGGIESLKNFWDSVPVGRNHEVAVYMLKNLASCPTIAEVLVANGFLSRVVAVLNCGVLGVRVGAAKTVYDLGYNAKVRRELGEIGCISPLVKMLDGKAIEEKEAAAKALSMLLVCTGNRRIFRKEERGIISTVQLLDPTLQNLDIKYPVSVLLLLVHSSKCRKQMVASAACVHLQKLAEMDVEGAKKLLESLGRGKLWGVFSRSL